MDVGSLVEQENRADAQREAGVEEGEHGAPESARYRDTERQGQGHRATGTGTQSDRDRDTERQGQTREPINRAAWVLDSILVSLSEGGLRDCPCQPVLIRNTNAPMCRCPPVPGPLLRTVLLNSLYITMRYVPGTAWGPRG